MCVLRVGMRGKDRNYHDIQIQDLGFESLLIVAILDFFKGFFFRFSSID